MINYSQYVFHYEDYLKWYRSIGLKHPFEYRKEFPFEIVKQMELPLQFGHTQFVYIRQRDKDGKLLDSGTIPLAFFD